MSAITQLNPPLPLRTPKGAGLAHMVIDYGPEHHLMWTVFIDATGECWTFANPEIRAAPNVTMGRTTLSPLTRSPELETASPARDKSNGTALR